MVCRNWLWQGWLYFIAAICQWLPLNYRLNAHRANSEQQKKCNFCLCHADETMLHLLVCPRFASEHLRLRQIVQEKLVFWKVPFCDTIFPSREFGLRKQWFNVARKMFHLDAVGSDRLHLLTKGFWLSSQHKPFISTASFLSHVAEEVQDRENKANPVLCSQLLNIIRRLLNIQSHFTTNSLEFSPCFSEWISEIPKHASLGAKLWLRGLDLVGASIFVSNLNERSQVWKWMSESLGAQAPTRFICLVPSQAVIRPHFLEIARFSRGSSIFDGSLSEIEMSLILGATRESFAIDPIDWSAFVESVTLLSDGWPSGSLTIPRETDTLFRERVFLPHLPRTLSPSFTPEVLLPSTLCFFDASAPKDSKSKARIIPDRAAKLIDKANQHNCFLGVLGILPNQLRTLLKESGRSDDIEEALDDISRSLFFAGFEIWNKRQRLGSDYWKDVAPENRKDPFKKGSGKAQQAEVKGARSNCSNPFHYLRRVFNLSKKRPTRCPCTAQLGPTSSGNQDVRTFLVKFPSFAIDKILPVNPTNFLTRSEATRRQQDSKKKRKSSNKKLTKTTKKAKYK